MFKTFFFIIMVAYGICLCMFLFFFFLFVLLLIDIYRDNNYPESMDLCKPKGWIDIQNKPLRDRRVYPFE